jgi:hypothetical protein
MPYLHALTLQSVVHKWNLLSSPHHYLNIRKQYHIYHPFSNIPPHPQFLFSHSWCTSSLQFWSHGLGTRVTFQSASPNNLKPCSTSQCPGRWMTKCSSVFGKRCNRLVCFLLLNSCSNSRLFPASARMQKCIWMGQRTGFVQWFCQDLGFDEIPWGWSVSKMEPPCWLSCRWWCAPASGTEMTDGTLSLWYLWQLCMSRRGQCWILGACHYTIYKYDTKRSTTWRWGWKSEAKACILI